MPQEHGDQHAGDGYLVDSPVFLEHQDVPLLVIDTEQGEHEGVVDITETELVGIALVQVHLALAVEEHLALLEVEVHEGQHQDYCHPYQHNQFDFLDG